MEIHRQTCQKCGSRNMRNLVVRNPGKPETIYVQCVGCDGFVASYVLRSMGYYHHGKGFESFLRSVESAGGVSSGKNLHSEYNRIAEEEEEHFAQVVKRLEELGKNNDLPHN